MTDDEKKEITKREKEINAEYSEKIASQFREFIRRWKRCWTRRS